MLTATLVSKERIEVQERPIPDGDGVLVKVLYCGICGSDMAKYLGIRERYPLVLGHEFCGIAQEGGYKGRLVAGIPMWYCEQCENCRKGLFELCNNHKYMGSTIDGGMCGYVRVPEKYLFDCDDLRDFSMLGALIEPCAVVLHSCNREELGSKIGIIGDGVLGTLLKTVLEVSSPSCEIRMVGKEDNVLEGWADSVFECSGRIGGFNSAVRMCNYRGTIRQLGILYPGVFVNGDFEFDNLLRKELTLKGCWNSNFRGDWLDTYGLICGNREKFSSLISKIYPLEKANEAFQDKKVGGQLKVMIKCE